MAAFPKALRPDRLPGGMALSTFIHLFLFGIGVGIIAWEEAHAEFRANLDMTNAPLLTLENRPVTPPEPWIMAKKGKAPPPLVEPSPTPEPSTAAVSRMPSWQSGLIEEEDYPMEMRKEKKEGRVIVEMLIDVGGNVKGVSLVQGADQAFNEVVLDKLKGAKFRPALDKAGQPINCRVRVPISFKLN